MSLVENIEARNEAFRLLTGKHSEINLANTVLDFATAAARVYEDVTGINKLGANTFTYASNLNTTRTEIKEILEAHPNDQETIGAIIKQILPNDFEVVNGRPAFMGSKRGSELAFHQ